MKLWLYGATLAVAGSVAQGADLAVGAHSFEIRCTVCHGGDGNGTERAPSLVAFVSAAPDAQLAMLIRTGVRAMPAHSIEDVEMADLIAHLRTLRPAAGAVQPLRTVILQDGTTLLGTVLNETNFNLQLATADGKLHLLVRDGDSYNERALQPKLDWPHYDGNYTSNRNSPLRQVNTANAGSLQLKWIFPVLGAPRLESTPIVIDGIMYVTAVNSAFALDAVSGRQLWAFQRPPSPGLLGEAAGGANRGVAVVGERVLMMTDNAHLIALDKSSGKLLWDTAMTDWPKSQYSASGAPLAIGDHVIAGVAGGEEGARGFIASYSVATGERDWQFWTVPEPGEKLSETWVGTALEHGCGATWMSGSYDPGLDLLYWAVGNPCPDYNGNDRQGDNLYTDSVLAMRPKTGELVWHYQFTPHDTHDWDADEPMLLIDEDYHGKPRKLLVQANRNGFFFVLDRSNGQFLQGTQFVSRSTWASGYTQAGKPILLPDSDPKPEGTLVCPASGTNWMSAGYNPDLKLFYFSSSNACGITKLIPAPFTMGERYFNGANTYIAGGRRSLRAMDIQTGKTVWEYAQTPGGRAFSGALSTSGGLVLFGEDSGVFTALDGRSGKPLWHFSANQSFRASPMSYMVGGRQYIAVAGAGGYMAFGLPDAPMTGAVRLRARHGKAPRP